MMRLLDRLAFWLEKCGEWIARALVAVGAGCIAFSFVPYLMNLRFVEVLAGGFALYQLFGFLMPKVCRWCRVGLAGALAAALFTTWISLPLQDVFGRFALVFVVWSCFTLIIDVLEIPHAEYVRDRRASMRSLGHAA
jgi:hypothetical protein